MQCFHFTFCSALVLDLDCAMLKGGATFETRKLLLTSETFTVALYMHAAIQTRPPSKSLNNFVICLHFDTIFHYRDGLYESAKLLLHER